MTEASSFNPLPRPMATDEDLTMPIVIYVLYLVSLPTAFLSLVLGLILAYAGRDRAGPAARSHYEFQIRTFWLSLIGVAVAIALCAVGAILSLILIGIPILMVGALMLLAGKLWFIIRCVLGIAKAAQKEAYPRPDAVLA